MKNTTMGCAFLLAAFAMAAAFVPVAESRTTPVEKTTTTQAGTHVHGVESLHSPMVGLSGNVCCSITEDGVKKPDCVPAFDPRSFPGHGGTTTPTPIPGHHGGGGSPAPSHSGGAYGSSPSTPSGGGSSPTPSHGGGAYGGGGGGAPATPASHDGHGLIPTTPGTCE